jgi:PAS domain S-box-containing protein
MQNSVFQFDRDQFNRLFPFYVLLDTSLTIVDVGMSLLKMRPGIINSPFQDHFLLKRPTIETLSFDTLNERIQELLIVEMYHDTQSLPLRGQLKLLGTGQLIFLGSPWFNTVDDLVQYNLSLNDFALHDPQVDLLHVLKSQEINSAELKELLSKVNKQKNELKRLSFVASSDHYGVLFTEVNGNISWANQGFCKLTGYELHEVLDQTPISLLRGPLSDKERMRRIVNDFTEGKNFDIKVICYRKDGTHFLGRCGGQAVYNSAGKLIEYFSLIEDVTLAKAKEEQFRILSLIAEENINGVVITDQNGRFNWVNKGFERMSGYHLDEVIGKKPGEVLQGINTNPETNLYLSNKIRSGAPFQCEILNYNKSGKEYWVRIQGQPIRNKSGKVTSYFALQEDITVERAGKEALRRSEERWQFALEGAGDGVWEYNFQTREVFFSRQYKQMLGFEEGQFPNRFEEWQSRVHPDDRMALDETEQQYKSGLTSHHQREFRMRNAAGQYIWILDRGMVVSRLENGEPLRIIGTHSDITERKSAEQALTFKEEKYRNIIANMNLGILEMDNEDRIQYANPSFCQLSGYEPDELVGAKSGELFGNHGNLTVSELEVRNKLGEQLWWLVSGAPSYNDKGERIGSIGIYLDITNQKKLQVELRDARELAEASSRAKETFLANMSHEIRTPMHAISGMVAILLKTKLTPNQKFHLEVIRTASENMIIILNDILDLSKLEASKLVMEKVGFELEPVLKKAVQVMKIKANEKRLGLILNVNLNDIDGVLIGDPFRLNQILFNLMSNAIKFTNNGQITVSCQWEKNEGNQQFLRFEVSDTGIGMDPEFLEHLFEKFSQEHQSTSRTYGGTGLGMNITRELIALMGGAISVQSQKGKGSTFTCIIPFEIGEKQDLPAELKPDNIGVVFKDLQVLLVDDNEMNRLVVNTLLNNLGAVVTEAVNGQEAVDMVAEKSDFNIILMDIQMPVMDGIEATAQIRKRKGNKIPIIALTANAMKSDVDTYKEAGMDAVLPKPFSEHALVNLLSLVLSNNGSMEVMQEEIKYYDLQLLKEMSVGNQEFIPKMLGLFLDQTPGLLKEMKEAIDQHDLAQLSKLGHKMKSMINTLGISEVKDDIRILEKAGSLNATPAQIEQSFRKLETILGIVFRQLTVELSNY